MNPATIQVLIDQAQLLHGAEEPTLGSIHTAFITSWVAWEAVQTRFIRVIIHHQGWLLKDADEVLARKRISSMKTAARVISSLGLPHPDHWSGISGESWRGLRDIEPLRNRLVHGFKSMEPARIQTATSIVLDLVSDRQWLEIVKLTHQGKEIKVGPLFNSRRSRISHPRSADELAKLLGVNIEKSSCTSNIPELAHLRKLESKLTNH